MIGTLLTLLGCLLLAGMTFLWWRSYLNPVTLGVLAWTPPLVMLNWPQFFLSPLYIHLNRPLTPLIYLALAFGFFSFWAGCALVKALSPAEAFAPPQRPVLRVDPRRMLILFVIGLMVFAYAYMQSGLADMRNMDEFQVAESRVALHIGWVSFIVFLMDFGAVAFFVRFLQSGRWLYTLPMVIALLCYSATLQKSPVVWLISASIFASALHPRNFYDLFLRRVRTRLLLVLLAVLFLAAMAVMNQARGMSTSRLAATPYPEIEQLYIYSGATAVKNLSATIDGYLPSDGPYHGAYLIRTLLWNFVDRDMFISGRHFEGVNTGTYLNFGWIDFRWLGFVILPFLTGVGTMVFIRAALSGTLVGLIAGAIAFRAVIFSIATDVMFEPVVWYTLVIALGADMLVRSSRAPYRPAAQLPPTRPRSLAPAPSPVLR